MPNPTSTNSNNETAKPGVIYRASNIALDIATLGVFTARYNKKHGWANPWTSDGKAWSESSDNHNRKDASGVAPQQQQQ
jgi:hypothetical protein